MKQIIDHHGKGKDSLFQVEYTSGDTAWLPYVEISHLEAFTQYLEALNIATAADLPRRVNPTQDLPLFGVSADEGDTCREAFDIIDQVLVNLADSAPSGNTFSSSNLGKPTGTRKTYKGRARSPPSTHSTPLAMNFTPLELERFRVTAEAINNGSFDIRQNVVPPGYINFCVLHANDDDQSLRYPLPPVYGDIPTGPKPGARRKSLRENKRGKGESRYLTKVIFDRFNADTASREHPRRERQTKTHRVSERAHAVCYDQPDRRRQKPYERSGGRHDNEYSKCGGRPRHFKNRSRDFRRDRNTPANTVDMNFNYAAAVPNSNDPFAAFHNYVPNVDAMLQGLNIDPAGENSQNTPAETVAGPSTGWTFCLSLLVTLMIYYLAATTPMDVATRT